MNQMKISQKTVSMKEFEAALMLASYLYIVQYFPTISAYIYFYIAYFPTCSYRQAVRTWFLTIIWDLS